MTALPSLHHPSWLDPTEFPFRSRFVELDGTTMHYVDEGSGPTLLLVHGSPMWSFMYRRVIADLSREYRCVAVDLPGLGLSRGPLRRGRAFEDAADLLQRFVHGLDLRETVLAVHATAGPAALEMAVRERGRFRALVVSNTFAWPLDDDPRMRFFVRLVSSRLFGLVNVWLNGLPRLTARLGRRTGRFSNAERAAILGPYRERQTRRHLQNLLYGVRVERDRFARLEQRLGGLADVPTLLLYGRHDNGYRVGFLERWRRILPRHEVAVLDDAGHFPLEDVPKQAVEVLREWLVRRAGSPVTGLPRCRDPEEACPAEPRG